MTVSEGPPHGGLLFEFLGRFRTEADTSLAVDDFMIMVPIRRAQSRTGQTGALVLRAESDGLASADITVGIYGRIYISGNGRGFLYSN